MAQKQGQPGTSSQDTPGAPRSKAKEHSDQAGEGGTKIWVNDRGETCIGNKCISLAFKEGDEDIVVRVDRNECGADMLPVIEGISEALGKGGRTLWETTSLRKK